MYKSISLESVGIYLVFLTLLLLIFNHLVFKYFILKRLKQYHSKIFELMGRPTIFSVKESMWSLIGSPKGDDIDVTKYLEKEKNSENTEHTLRLLKKYKFYTDIELWLAFTAIFILIIDKYT